MIQARVGLENTHPSIDALFEKRATKFNIGKYKFVLGHARSPTHTVYRCDLGDYDIGMELRSGYIPGIAASKDSIRFGFFVDRVGHKFPTVCSIKLNNGLEDAEAKQGTLLDKYVSEHNFDEALKLAKILCNDVTARVGLESESTKTLSELLNGVKRFKIGGYEFTKSSKPNDTIDNERRVRSVYVSKQGVLLVVSTGASRSLVAVSILFDNGEHRIIPPHPYYSGEPGDDIDGVVSEDDLDRVLRWAKDNEAAENMRHRAHGRVALEHKALPTIANLFIGVKSFKIGAHVFKLDNNFSKKATRLYECRDEKEYAGNLNLMIQLWPEYARFDVFLKAIAPGIDPRGDGNVAIRLKVDKDLPIDRYITKNIVEKGVQLLVNCTQSSR